MTIPVVCVVGRSKSGKTTLLEKMIILLKQRGYRVATIKHHSHHGFDMDVPGKDTWRHAQAGSDHVIIAAPDKVAAIRSVSVEPTLDELVATVTDVDIILTEGYKRSSKPKIEVLRAERSATPICTADELLALVTDVPVNLPVRTFALDDAAGVVDLLEEMYLK